ncbi:MAG: exopolysaccharide biosynthesis polyprenyl glycosylphosphotransferase [Caulobacteraceae bacterium]|nr:exopolysaccharide biosynthesis polyprenyl glycosylphosphotransferase [Caulobacteraceae bacterium]
MISYTFRALDALALFAAAIAVCNLTAPGGLWASPLALVVPYLAAPMLALASLNAFGAYAFRGRERILSHLSQVAMAFLGAAAIVGLCLILAHGPRPLATELEREWMICLAVMVCLHLLWLALVRRWRRLGYLTPNIVIVGANENARVLIRRAMETGEIAVLGIFDDRHRRAPDAIEGVPVLGDTDDLVSHRIMPFVDRVVITVTSTAKTRVRTLVDRLRILPNDITLFVDLGGNDSAAATLDRIADLPLARMSGRRPGNRRMVAKRLQDLVFGALALMLATPLMLLVALAVKLESPGPIFFRQRRQGFNNETIVVWKFRSMRHDQRDERAIKQVRYDDPRITRVGRIIRRTSLDELPQLFNVLAGSMSLVGPRPHAPGMKTGDIESALLVADYAHRHRIKPGMTGWAAIHGSRGPVDTPELVRRRVELDIAYIERQSFWLDLYTLIMTLPCLFGDGRVAR